MKKLFYKVQEIFPEIYMSIRLIDSPYEVMHEIVYWLEDGSSVPDREIVKKRMLQFKEWCFAQEEGETAEDDLMTIYQIALLKNLCRDEKTHYVIPYLIDKNIFEECRDYYIKQTSTKTYEDILKLF
ncbi:MAG: hypothetical protein MK105_13430 [Crocinitomicaceae bacterium]|nr:hypothetical protein [Crocinitomicaceae bacterium]